MDKKTKKRNNKKQIDESIVKKKKNKDTDVKVREISETVSINRYEQRIIDNVTKHDEHVPQLEKKKQKFKKVKTKLGEKNVLNKKIFFDDEDEESHEVVDTGEPANKKNKNKKFLNEDEADVKEEDIDQFCDEITEEDNQQYEDWVKLIEAKLHSNKKSK